MKCVKMDANKVIKHFYAAVVIAAVLVIVSALASTTENIIINNEKTNTFNEGWTCTVNGESIGKIDLPTKIDAKKNDVVVIKNNLPENYTPGMTISFRSVQKAVKVYANDNLLYEYGVESTRPFGKSPGSAWNFVRLDNETKGGQIEIEMISPYSAYSGTINDINYGSKNANVFKIISNNWVSLIISILILVLGLFVLAAHFLLFKKTKSDALLYLGLFALLAGGWTLMETRLMQFVFSNQFAIAIAAFVIFMLLPIPFLLFIAETHNIHNKKWFYNFSYLFLLNFIISIILQVFNVLDFIEIVMFNHLLVLVAAAFIIYIIVVEIVKFKNKRMHVLGAGALIVVFMSLFDFVTFYGKITGDMSFFFRLGMFFYTLILSYYTIREILSMMSQNLKTEALEKLAFIDLLTGLNNRTSFEKGMEKYRENAANCKALSIGIFDVNGLKAVNDTFGHKEGDNLIIMTAGSLTKVFGEFSKIYRVGGDEFVIIMENMVENALKESLLLFEEEIALRNIGRDYIFDVAYGIGTFNTDIDKNADELYVRADGYMYERKNKSKKKHWGIENCG